MIKVLFVCTGNICRSPAAEAVFAYKAAEAGLEFHVDSAGTSNEEEGNPPHPTSTQVTELRGYTMPNRRARQVQARDFKDFDLLIAMTQRHADQLTAIAGCASVGKVRLMTSYSHVDSPDIPDPWYGGYADYELALDMIEEGVEAMVQQLNG